MFIFNLLCVGEGMARLASGARHLRFLLQQA
jgi:hypothetical protein